MAGRKSWETKEFRIAREKAKKDGKIKDHCEGCGSKEKPLVAHHTTFWVSYLKKRIDELVLQEMEMEKNWRFNLSKFNPKSRKRFFEMFPQTKDKIMGKAKELALKDYYAFDGIETLCNKCHLVKHRYHRELCRRCKKRWFIPHKDNTENVCWECNYDIEDEGDDFDIENEKKQAEIEMDIDEMTKNLSEPRTPMGAPMKWGRSWS